LNIKILWLIDSNLKPLKLINLSISIPRFIYKVLRGFGGVLGVLGSKSTSVSYKIAGHNQSFGFLTKFKVFRF
jgi:hypothetical protein